MATFSFPRALSEIDEELKGSFEKASSVITSIVEKRQADRLVQFRSILLGPPPRECAKHEQFFLYGSGMTGENGQVRIPLTAYLCSPNINDPQAARFAAQDIPWFVATPVSRTPCYITHSVDIVELTDPLPQGSAWVPWPAVDIFVQVYTWLANGDPAPFVQFSWHCSANCTKFYNP